MTLLVIVMGYSEVSSQADGTCPALKGRLEKEIAGLTSLNNTYQELNARFEESVQDDFTAQAEGFLDEIRRNEAVKLAFARKRLNQNRELKKQQVQTLRAQYCPKCNDEKLCSE